MSRYSSDVFCVFNSACMDAHLGSLPMVNRGHPTHLALRTTSEDQGLTRAAFGD